MKNLKYYWADLTSPHDFAIFQGNLSLQYLNDGNAISFGKGIREAFKPEDFLELCGFLDDLDYDSFVEYIDEKDLEPYVRCRRTLSRGSKLQNLIFRGSR